MADSFERATLAAAFPETGRLATVIKGWSILVCRVEGVFHAVINRCPHAGSSFDDGRLRRGAIICPLHGAMFDLASGRCLGGPYAPLKTFETRLVDGWLEVCTPDQPPAAEHMPISPTG